MAIIKKKALKEMSATDKGKKLAELRLELAKDRAQIALGASPQNPGRVRELRRAIARLLTKAGSRGTKRAKRKNHIESKEKKADKKKEGS